MYQSTYIVLLILCLISTNNSLAQDLLLTENMETDDNGSNYRANVFNDSGSDVFTRSENSNNGPNNNTEHPYSNYLGNDWWCGEDIDATENPLGTGSDGYFMLKTIDVSEYAGGMIELSAYLAGNTGTPHRFEVDDFLKIAFAFDDNIAIGANTIGAVPSETNLVTGNYTTFAAWYGLGNNLVTATSSALIQDVDLDGAADNPATTDSLKNTFIEWSFSLPVPTGTSNLSILFTTATNTGSEDFGIDHIRIFGMAPLPIKLVSFNATRAHNHVLLDWETATENSNMGFEIEKSINGTDWSKIGFVEGSGTSFEVNYYSFMDKNANNQPSYYRLKQLDIDRLFSYSSIVHISPTKENCINIYPNPTTGSTKIVGSFAENTLITIVDQLGKLVFKQAISNTHNTIDFSNYPKGLYILHMNFNNEIITKKILKR